MEGTATAPRGDQEDRLMPEEVTLICSSAACSARTELLPAPFWMLRVHCAAMQQSQQET